MKIIDPILSGSVNSSGSLTIPRGRANQKPSSPKTGSIFLEISDSGSNLVVYNGSGSSGWEIVGEQTTPPPDVSRDVEYLLVAGGGGAGFDLTAGGGAGGLLSSSLNSVTSGSTFTVTIGAGGAGYTTGTVAAANDGDDSTIAGDTISTITAIGGGGGSRVVTNPGRDGGSGGGCGRGNQGVTTPGSGTVGQGNDGGADTDSPAGTGGGGAGAAGGTASGTANPSNGGNGGIGKQSSITGTSTYYAGGGGGGGYYGSAGTGGSGGGGNGSGGNGQNNQESGEANTGGGGGGGGQNSTAAASGGSGVAIFAYDSGSINCAGGIVGDAGNGRKYHQFNSSGTFKIGNTNDFKIHTSNLVMHVDAGQSGSRGTSTTAYDLSGYNNNLNLAGQSGGTLTANPWWNCDGTGGLADFERNGGSTASNVAHTGYGSFTGRTTVGWCIEFWIKSTASGGHSSQGKTIIGRNNTDIYGSISIFSNKLAWIHYDGSWSQEQSTTSINDGSWHHCVLNNNSDETIDIWVDGTKENDGAASAINPDSRFFKMDSLGRGYDAENTAMDIGQIRVYDATLTDAQITQNYNATKTNFI